MRTTASPSSAKETINGSNYLGKMERRLEFLKLCSRFGILRFDLLAVSAVGFHPERVYLSAETTDARIRSRKGNKGFDDAPPGGIELNEKEVVLLSHKVRFKK